jgi:hypothetical protein
MAARNTPRNRKERRAAAQEESITSSADIPLAQPSRTTPKHKTLYEIATEREAELRQGQPFSLRSEGDGSEPLFTSRVINPDGSLSADEDSPPTADELIGPFGQALFHAVTLTMLHTTLDFLVHQQYRQDIDWSMIAGRTATTFPVMLILIYILHSHAGSPWAQFLFLAMSTVAGCYLIHSSNKEPYFAVMQRAPPLGTLWVWSVIELRLEVAALSLVIVIVFFWSGDYRIFGL